MQFSNSNYYSAMDHLDNTRVFESEADAPIDEEGNPVISDGDLNYTAREIGTTTNPMGNTLQSLKEKIMEGASRIEFEFIGQGKGNSQQPTPESFGKKERQDMRELLSINKMKTSTHASVHSQSLAGFGQRGFNDEAKAQALKEIKKAIHFAGEATKGGAVVFHMQEWQRPMSQLKDTTGGKFKAYDEEDQDAVLFAVDKRTGEAVSTISKNREVFRPKYETAKDLGLAGRKDNSGNILKDDDWVDVRGNLIPKDANVERLFDRVPRFNKDKTNFEVEKLTWDKLVEETTKWNKDHPHEVSREPEEMFAILESENKVLQAKGSSLFHAQNYEELKHRRDEVMKDYELYKKVRDLTPEDEKWKLKGQFLAKQIQYGQLRDGEEPETFYEREIRDKENHMRYIHEASSSADVQAKQFQEVIENIESAKKYGLKRTADTIAKSAIYAMDTYNQNKSKYGLEDPLYVAPENWDPKMYGSHPDEYKEAIKAARGRMVDLLVKTHGKSKEEAQKLAKTHIKGTLDIGHLNMYREHWEGNPKDFDKWLLNQAESLVKEGYVGHIHLTDNMGFDDEHLTPGQGNVPMKEFLKRMEQAGIKDIIVEPGSYNPKTAMYDTLSLINSPVYSARRLQRFGQVRDGHFGYNAPGFFIAGAYAPSNEWKTWTGLDLE